jgi:5'-nucleotidase
MIWADEKLRGRKERAMRRITGLFVAGCAVLFFGNCIASPQTSPVLQTSPAPLKILITNDDGIEAPGLAALFEHLSKIGTVTVAAPATEASGSSHSMTSQDPIYVDETEKKGAKWFAIKGTPATCVRLAVESLMADKPDIVISGINRGQNLGTITFYSATLGAAREAALCGIPSIAMNLARERTMDYTMAAEFTVELIKSLKDRPMKKGTFLNVNVPNLPKDQIKGILAVPQDARGPIIFFDKRATPSGQTYFWYAYKRIEPDANKTDIWGVANGYITITPFTIDQTSYEEMKKIDSLKIEGWKK